MNVESLSAINGMRIEGCVTVKTITPPDAIGHDACNQTIDELLRLVESQRALLEAMTESLKTANQTIGALNSLMALIPTAKTEKRGRGRPKKNADDSWMVEAFNSTMLPEFIAANPYKKSTDSEVLTWYFTKEYARYRWSASRVRGKVFQGKLKTLKNRLGDARNPIATLPIK